MPSSLHPVRALMLVVVAGGLVAQGCGGSGKPGAALDGALPGVGGAIAAGGGAIDVGVSAGGRGGGLAGAGGVAGTGGSAASCGLPGTPCCGANPAQGTCTAAGTVCSNSVCLACGTLGSGCCANSVCSTGCCSGGTCVASPNACTPLDASVASDTPLSATGGRTGSGGGGSGVDGAVPVTGGARGLGGMVGGAGGTTIGGSDGGPGATGGTGTGTGTGGASTGGATGTGGNHPDAGPAQVDGLVPGPKLAVAAHACAIWGTELRCWGSNSMGELGYVGRGTQNATPAVVAGEWLAVAVANAASDDGFTCAIKTDLSLWCWGVNARGSLGRGTTSSGAATAVPGKVGDGFVRVAIARHSGCAIKTDGSLWCWGEGGYALLGGGSMTDTGKPTQVAAGSGPFIDVDMKDAAAGAVHRTLVDGGSGDDVFWSWGHRYDPDTTVISEANKYKSTAGPQLASAADTLGAAARQVSVAESQGILRSATGVWRFAQYGYPTLDATAPAGAIDVAACGRNNMCLVDGEHKLWCRGDGRAGQLGDGFWVKDHNVPPAEAWTQVKAPQGKWTDVVVGYGGGIACARDTDDVVWCWGNNAYGTLGDGTFKSRSAPSPVGQAPPSPTCSDGIGNGDEQGVDCGGSCPACPPWCEDMDGDGYGRGGACLGTDCDDDDATIFNTCWIRTLFGGQPGTKPVAGTIEKNDQVCVVSFSGSACYAENDPPCRADTTPTDVTLDVTLAENGALSVEVPYQEMCAVDYLGPMCDVDGNLTGALYPQSYAIPMSTTFWYAKPRDLDKCRVDLSGNDTIIEQRASTSIVGQQIWITQDCFTQLGAIDPDTGNNVPLFDTRRWTVKLGEP